MNKDIKIYLWPGLESMDSSVLLQRLPPAEVRRVKEISHPRRRHEFICGRVLLRRIFSDSKLPEEFSFNEHGKPFAPGYPEFNISHSRSHIAVVVSGSPVGLDIEIEDSQRKVVPIAESYGSQAELDLLKKLSPNEQISAFYKMWVLKESYAKASGRGLEQTLQQLEFSFTENKIIKTPVPGDCEFFYYRSQTLHLSACVLAKESPSPQLFNVVLNSKSELSIGLTENSHFEKFVLLVPGIATHN